MLDKERRDIDYGFQDWNIRYISDISFSSKTVVTLSKPSEGANTLRKYIGVGSG